MPFACLDPEKAVIEAERLYERAEPAWIAVENVHALNIASSDLDHKETLLRADLVLNDGKGVLLGARILGRRFPADLHGNVFSPLILEHAAKRGWPVFLLGAAPRVAARAAERLLERNDRLHIVGTHDGYFSAEEEEAVVKEIRSAGTGLLMVGMGMPMQERWLDDNLDRTGARLGVTVGAFLDFQASVIPRAPDWMNRSGLEWVFRLAKEPWRLWRRYLLGNPLFVARVVRQRITMSRHRGARPLKG